jgi:hypothetical protein
VKSVEIQFVYNLFGILANISSIEVEYNFTFPYYLVIGRAKKQQPRNKFHRQRSVTLRRQRNVTLRRQRNVTLRRQRNVTLRRQRSVS